MVQHKCLKLECDGTMSLVGVALNGTLFYWCPECKRLFMVFDTGMWNTVEYKMKKWQPPAAQAEDRLQPLAFSDQQAS